MGPRTSRLTGAGDAAVLAEVAMLPSPRFEELFWMATCRPLGSLSRFSERLLLFRPDCRLFCARGTGCKLLADGESARTHRELFIHTTVEAVRAEASRDLASRSPTTVVVNDEAASVALPFVSHCWALDRALDFGSSGNCRAVTPEVLSGRTVIVWVHGFRQRFFRVVSVGHHLLSLLGMGAGEEKPAVVTFLWPCHLGAAGYGRARADAEHASPHLSTVLNVLHACNCRVVVVGHSLGCLVALRSLLRPCMVETEDHICSHLLLLGAAVPSNALSASGDFPRSRVAATDITVLSSANDDVLRKFFGIGESVASLLSGRLLVPPSAMGLVGPTVPVPAGVRQLDVSATVSSHNPNTWLRSSDVLGPIAAAAGSSGGSYENGLCDADWPVAARSGAVSDNDIVSLEDEEDGA